MHSEIDIRKHMPVPEADAAGALVTGAALVSVGERQEALRRAEDELGALIKGTEGDFLSVGSHLKDIICRASVITDRASEITTLFSGEEIVKAITELREFVNAIASYYGTVKSCTERRTAQLERIRMIIQGITDPLKEFRGNTKTLRTLCVATKIQSASLDSSADDFTVLAEDVSRLSEVIDGRSGSISKTLATMERRIGQALSLTQTRETGQRTRLDNALHDSDQAVSALIVKYDRSRSVGEEIAADSDAISRSINEVVTAIQFHDITRQKFEHIRTALHDVRMAGLQAVPSESACGSTNSIVLEECRAAVASLTATRDELGAAAGGIRAGLLAVSEHTKAIRERALSLAGKTDHGPGLSISEIEDSVSSAADAVSALIADAAADRDIAAVVQMLEGATGEIGAFVGDIDDIGEELKLIALNSMIKAEKIGEKGLPLSTVADFIRRLAESSQEKAGVVSASLRTVTCVVTELSADDGNGRHMGESDMKKMSEELSRMRHRLHALNEEVVSLVHQISERGTALITDVEEVIRTMKVDEEVTDTVSRIVSGLENLLPRAARMASGAHRSGNDDPFAGAASGRYAQALCGAAYTGSRSENMEDVELF